MSVVNGSRIVARRHAAEHAVAQRLDDVAALDQRRRLDELHGAAVVLGDDHVLGHVDQPAGQVPGVGRLERGVGETLAGPVRRREVLEHGQAFAEVRDDRRLDDLARRLGHEAAHARELADLLLGAPRPGVRHHVDRVELAVFGPRLHLLEQLVGDLLRDVRPDVDDLVVALAVGDHAVLVLLLHVRHLAPRALDQRPLRGRDLHVDDTDAEPRQRRVPEADVLQLVEERHRRLVAEAVVAIGDELADLLLLQLPVHEAERLRHDLVQEDPAHRREQHAAVPAQADARLEVHVLVVVRDADFLGVGEQALLALGARPLLGHVVDAEDHVLARHRDRRAVGRLQDVVGGEHQHLRLHLRFHGERHVHRHLIAVEVGVEGRADQRVDLDGLALDEQGLEGLDAEAVEGRGPVEQHRVLLDDLLQDVPHFRPLLLHVLLGRLDRRGHPAVLELAEDERLEQLERHLLGQPALVELQVRPHHDDRPAGIVHALAEQVLAEAPLLALERVGQGLERTVVGAGDDPAAPAVVEQRVDRLLQHALLVAHDDVGRAQLDEPLQPVVAVDDAPVQVVEVGGREAAAVQRHQRAQLGRDDRQHLEDHPLRLVPRLQEGLDDLQALDDLLLLLGRGLDTHLRPELARQRVEVEAAQLLADRLGAHPHGEGVGAVLLVELA